MNTFKFTTEAETPIHVPTALKLSRQWAKRRPFPIRIVEVTTRFVFVEIDAPDNGVHNRAVQSLARILSRHLDETHFVESRLNPTFH
jgi:hypothetical protein